MPSLYQPISTTVIHRRSLIVQSSVLDNLAANGGRKAGLIDGHHIKLSTMRRPLWRPSFRTGGDEHAVIAVIQIDLKDRSTSAVSFPNSFVIKK